MSTSHQVAELCAQAHCARERHHLYRAKMYGLRPTTTSRLRELERISEGAEARLRRAQEEHTPLCPAGPAPAYDHRPSNGVTDVDAPGVP